MRRASCIATSSRATSSSAATACPILIDFGAARLAIGGRTQTLTSILTPQYAPIEQYAARRQAGPVERHLLGRRRAASRRRRRAAAGSGEPRARRSLPAARQDPGRPLRPAVPGRHRQGAGLRAGRAAADRPGVARAVRRLAALRPRCADPAHGAAAAPPRLGGVDRDKDERLPPLWTPPRRRGEPRDRSCCCWWCWRASRCGVSSGAQPGADTRAACSAAAGECRTNAATANASANADADATPATTPDARADAVADAGGDGAEGIGRPGAACRDRGPRGVRQGEGSGRRRAHHGGRGAHRGGPRGALGPRECDADHDRRRRELCRPGEPTASARGWASPRPRTAIVRPANGRTMC